MAGLVQWHSSLNSDARAAARILQHALDENIRLIELNNRRVLSMRHERASRWFEAGQAASKAGAKAVL
jgi:hypothetical protein